MEPLKQALTVFDGGKSRLLLDSGVWMTCKRPDTCPMRLAGAIQLRKGLVKGLSDRPGWRRSRSQHPFWWLFLHLVLVETRHVLVD